jgi:hypothetical protein
MDWTLEAGYYSNLYFEFTDSSTEEDMAVPTAVG